MKQLTAGLLLASVLCCEAVNGATRSVDEIESPFTGEVATAIAENAWATAGNTDIGAEIVNISTTITAPSSDSKTESSPISIPQPHVAALNRGHGFPIVVTAVASSPLAAIAVFLLRRQSAHRQPSLAKRR